MACLLMRVSDKNFRLGNQQLESIGRSCTQFRSCGVEVAELYRGELGYPGVGAVVPASESAHLATCLHLRFGYTLLL